MVGAIEPISSAQPATAVNRTNPISPQDLLIAEAEAEAATPFQPLTSSSPLSATTQALLLNLRESGALAPLPGSPTPAAALQQGLSDLSVALTEIQAALNSAGQTGSVATLSLAGIPLTSSVLSTALTQLNAAINNLNTPSAAISPGLLLYEQTLEALTTVAPPDPNTTEANPLTGLPHISSVV
jgi:hypothetical protein